MQFCADLHTHTLASGHALSTLSEMVAGAKKLNYSALAVTDHAFSTSEWPARFYFNNLLSLPDVLEDDFWLLKGVEGSVLDSNGTLDIREKLLPRFDWVIASIHSTFVEELDYAEATRAWLAVAENPYVDMIGHCEQQQFLFDYNLVAKAFAKNNKVVEINGASSRVRPNSGENQRQLALCCREHGVHIAVSSDAHSCFGMDVLQPLAQMLHDIEYPEEWIVNTSRERLWKELKLHKKPFVERVLFEKEAGE